MDLSPENIPSLKVAHDALRDPLSRFLQSAAPDWIVYDFCPHWLPPIAAGLRVGAAFFSIFPPWCLAYLGSTAALLGGGEGTCGGTPESFTAPPEWGTLRSKSNVAYRLHEAKGMLALYEENVSGVSDTFRLGSAIGGCDVILIRACEEVERDWLSLIGVLHDKPVVPVGLVPPPKDEDDDDDGGGDTTWQDIRSWLDGHGSASVVYAALGSEVALSPDELAELAHGLELSGSPFFWALRNPAWLPQGFEEGVKGRGMVWTSWAPQLRILGHDSVGGFLTHCGWGSVIEGLSFGQPLIMLPIWGDQPVNARVADKLKAGVEIPRDEENESLSRDSVAESVKSVMALEGKCCRERTTDLKEKIFGNQELHDKYIDGVVEYLQKHIP